MMPSASQGYISEESGFVWEERTQSSKSIWAEDKDIKILFLERNDLSLNTCSMAYDELKTPLLLLLELVEESAELPDGVPLPEVFTVSICSSEKPSWWSNFWSLFTVSCKKRFLNYWEEKEEDSSSIRLKGHSLFKPTRLSFVNICILSTGQHNCLAIFHRTLPMVSLLWACKIKLNCCNAFIRSFKQLLVSIYHVLGTVLKAKNSKKPKTRIPALERLPLCCK